MRDRCAGPPASALLPTGRHSNPLAPTGHHSTPCRDLPGPPDAAQVRAPGEAWGAVGRGTEPRRRPGTYLVGVTEATRTADGTAGPSVDVAAEGARIAANISRVIEGKPDVVRLALVVLLAEGHLLIEDVPGVGKTTLAKALAASIDATVRRIQFTPDLLPSDVTGVSVYDQETREFEF